MLTNLLGTVVMVLTTNYTHTTYQPVKCTMCGKPHHYTAEDHYHVSYDVVVTNFVEHPAVHKTPPMLERRVQEVPPLPPPILLRRSNTNGLPSDK